MGGTKIIVVQLKELIKNTIFAILGLALIIMLLYFFIPNADSSSTASVLYKPGTYSTEVMLEQTPIKVDVTVSETQILSIELISLDNTQEVFYPLIKPTMETITQEIIKKQSLNNISVSPEQAETGKLLIYTIQLSLNKAKIQ